MHTDPTSLISASTGNTLLMSVVTTNPQFVLSWPGGSSKREQVKFIEVTPEMLVAGDRFHEDEMKLPPWNSTLISTVAAVEEGLLLATFNWISWLKVERSLQVVRMVDDTPRGQEVGTHASLYNWNEAGEELLVV